MKNKLSVIVCTIACFSFLSADEFFEPSSKIGGYGELHWNQQYDENGNQSKNQLDFHRFIIYYGHNWTEKWSFHSELELEHNNVIPGDTDTDGSDTDVTKTGELELEQAFVNYHAGNWGFQGGVILPSVGLLNEYHEPPLFLSVERPDYNKRIIPTTWFGNGFAFYGRFTDFNWRVAMLEDLNGESISDGIRSARGKGFLTSAYSWTKNISASYTGINGLRLGGSLTMNNAPFNNDKDNTIGVNLFEVNAKYNANNIVVVFEFGKISYENNPGKYVDDDNNEITDKVHYDIDSSSGYYLDLGYNVGSLLGYDGKIIPWVRFSNIAKGDNVDALTYKIFRTGLTYNPIHNIAFKLDYATVTIKDADFKTTSELNIGIGYSF